MNYASNHSLSGGRVKNRPFPLTSQTAYITATDIKLQKSKIQAQTSRISLYIYLANMTD